MNFGWLDGSLDAVSGKNTDKSIEKVTERLLAKNIIFSLSFAALISLLRKWEYNIFN